MWPEDVAFTDDYGFKSSPESCSDTSFTTDILDHVTDEDFITQLSSTLDFPLDPVEDDHTMSALNSFFDKSPEELLSTLTSSPDYFMNDSFNITNDFSKPNSTDKIIEVGPARNTKPDPIQLFDYLNGVLNSQPIKEEHSEESCSSNNSLEPSTPPPSITDNVTSTKTVFFPTNILPKREVNSPEKTSTKVQVVPQKVPIKRVLIKPKAPYTVPTKSPNIVFIKNIKTEFPRNNASNIVVLDSIPVNTFKPIAVPRSGAQIDPKILKRQERRIKNRESASISRKKKKDYLTSLEDRVKGLTIENNRLLKENQSLKERLSFYEGDFTKTPEISFSVKAAKPGLILCAFLLVVGLNLNLARGPFLKSNLASPESTNYPKLPNSLRRSLLWADEANGDDQPNNTYFSPLTMCPAYINQSESARLLLELERLIGKPEVFEPELSKPKKISSYKQKKKRLRLTSSSSSSSSSLAQVRKRLEDNNDFRNEIQVFNPKVDPLYSEFYAAINRRDDTFYVVSFSEQHMLLPALYHNNTRRPKMSLLMPSVFPNETSSTQTFIPMMQIDCEVLDTKLVNVKYGSIPRPYRQYGNFTKDGDNTKRKADNATSFRKYGSKKAYKPYFLGKDLEKVVDYN